VKISPTIVTAVSTVLAGVFSLGFAIDTGGAQMPDDAIVFADDAAQIYYAPSCVAAWLSLPTQAHETLRGAELREMLENGYKPEARCRQAGAFAPSGRSLSGLLLQKAGVLPAKKQWWDKPYHAENGVLLSSVV
jgi:hypothetical protein